MTALLGMRSEFVQTAIHVHTKTPFLVHMPRHVNRKAGFRGHVERAGWLAGVLANCRVTGRVVSLGLRSVLGGFPTGQMGAEFDADIRGEMDCISQALTQRVMELVERYEVPMPKMSEGVVELDANVNRHLEKTGFAWK